MSSEITATPPAADLRPEPADSQVTVPEAPRTLKKRRNPVMMAISAVASLRLTVTLFALSIFLVLCGTLAQVDAGIWTVVNQYFRSLYVWVPLQLFFPRSWHVSGGFPYPGGWLLGGVLLANLLSAHVLLTVKLIRVRSGQSLARQLLRRSGVYILHIGLVVMMLSELVTGLYAVEARMVIADGETSNFTDVSGAVELALINTTSPQAEEAVVIPGSFLRNGGVIQNDLLPVDVEVLESAKNSDLLLVRGGKETANEVRSTDGRRWMAEARPEGTGVGSDQREDAAMVRVNFRKKGTEESVGGGLFSLWFYPNFNQRQMEFAPRLLTVDGRTYRIEFRYQRVYKPYSIRLKKFTHEVYIGTDVPKNFASLVQLNDPSQHEDREVLIYMNQPLRYSGETFYQQGFLPGDTGTVLQVVRNPGWLLPYISCIVVALGMMIHFGLHLFDFLRTRTAS